LALKDGTILLSQKGMEICYQAEDKNIGDARVAFVLGHEMAHLGNDDFWHIGESLRVLVLEGVVELVEYPVSKPMPLSEINSGYGKPCRMFVSPSGVKTLVYEDFAVDVRDDLITGVILFEKGRS